MSKIALVALHEYRTLVLRTGFLVGLLVVPLGIAVMVGVQLYLHRPKAASLPVGVVDSSGFLSAPADEGKDGWIPYPGEEQAREALEAGRIGAFWVLPPDYPVDPRVKLVHDKAPGKETVREFQSMLRTRLLAGTPPEAARRIAEGPRWSFRSPGATRELPGEISGGMVLPPLIALASLLLIFFGAGYLLQAFVEEKASRTLEILATSVSPGRLVAGKVLGIAAATLTQLAVWGGFAVLAVVIAAGRFGPQWLAALRPDASTILVTIALLLPTYVLLCAIMTALGATIVEPLVGQQIVAFSLSIFFMIVAFTLPLMEDTGNPLSVILSFAPVLAPVLLPLRSLFASVPAWQVGVAIAIQVVLALGALWLAGRALRLMMLAYGEPFLRRGGGTAHRHLATGAVLPPPAAGSRGVPHVPRAFQKTLLVAWHELTSHIVKPSFLALLFGLPVLVILQLVLIRGGAETRAPERAKRTVLRTEVPAEAQGFVDDAGLLGAIPPDMAPGVLVRYPDEASARSALARGAIRSYVLIPADHLASGRLVLVRPEGGRDTRGRQTELLPRVLQWNLLGRDEALLARYRDPMEMEAVPLASATPESPSGAPGAAGEMRERAQRLTGLVTMILFYAVLLMSSGFILRSLSDEKKNRVMEVLLLSVSPRELLAGKTIGLGILGLVQAGVWGSIAMGFAVTGGRFANLPPGLRDSVAFWAWGAVFLLLGYALYAALLGGAGALIPDVKESPHVAFVLSLPALVGFLAALACQDAPHSPLAVGLGLFPLTSPFVMMMRLAVGDMPPWQAILSAAILGVTAVLATRAAARMFRAQMLLSGQRFTFGRYVGALLGRA